MFVNSKFKYLRGIVKRSLKIGLVNTLNEIKLYYKRYSNLPRIKYNKIEFKYKLYVIYTYIKLTYYLFDKDSSNILDFVPRRIQQYLLPIINPLDKKQVLVDKVLFYRILKDKNLPYPQIYFHIKDNKPYDVENNQLKSLSIFEGKEIYVKVRDGSSGKGAEIIKFDSRQEMLRDNCIYQERLHTADSLMMLADVNSFNTCRVSTYIDNEGSTSVDLAYLKLGGKNNAVDNIASGGIGIPININTGELNKTGFIEFGSSFEVDKHPCGKIKFEGFIIPEWDTIKDIAIKAHQAFKELRHISWDIGLTDKGPIIVEGNSGGDIFANQLVGNKRYYYHKVITDTFH